MASNRSNKRPARARSDSQRHCERRVTGEDTGAHPLTCPPWPANSVAHTVGLRASSLAHAVGLPVRHECDGLEALLLLAQLLLVLGRRGNGVLELVEAQEKLLEQLRLPVARARL